MDIHYCYILSNNNNNRTVLNVGYTEYLKTRIVQHKKRNGAVFTKKYSVYYLVYFEVFDINKDAKSREKQLKNWHKEWKWNLVKEENPSLETLSLN